MTASIARLSIALLLPLIMAALVWLEATHALARRDAAATAYGAASAQAAGLRAAAAEGTVSGDPRIATLAALGAFRTMAVPEIRAGLKAIAADWHVKIAIDQIGDGSGSSFRIRLAAADDAAIWRFLDAARAARLGVCRIEKLYIGRSVTGVNADMALGFSHVALPEGTAMAEAEGQPDIALLASGAPLFPAEPDPAPPSHALFVSVEPRTP